MPVADFFLRDLNRTPDGDAFCFSYSALDRYAVHNASLLGASVLLRLDGVEPNPEARDAALAARNDSDDHCNSRAARPFGLEILARQTPFDDWRIGHEEEQLRLETPTIVDGRSQDGCAGGRCCRQSTHQCRRR
jgi:hypothetical protein